MRGLLPTQTDDQTNAKSNRNLNTRVKLFLEYSNKVQVILVVKVKHQSITSMLFWPFDEVYMRVKVTFLYVIAKDEFQ